MSNSNKHNFNFARKTKSKPKNAPEIRRTKRNQVRKMHMGGPAGNMEYHEHQCSDWNGEAWFIGMNTNINLCNMAGYDASLYNPYPNPVAGCSSPPCCQYNEATLTCESVFSSGVMPGDATSDGQVNVMDVVRIVGHITGDVTLVGEQLQAADYNGDGFVDVNDVVALVNQIAGSFPPQQQSAMQEHLRRALAPLGVNISNTVRRLRRRR